MRGVLLIVNILGLIANTLIVAYSLDSGIKLFNVFAGCFSIIAIFSLAGNYDSNLR